MTSSTIAVAAALIVVAAGSNPVLPRDHSSPRSHSTRAIPAPRAPAAPKSNDACTFAQGTTTCIVTFEYTYTTSHVETSGCLYGPTGIPGRRSRTYEDVFLVTVTVTSYIHGRSGAPYDVQTTSTQEWISSRLISDVCEVL